MAALNPNSEIGLKGDAPSSPNFLFPTEPNHGQRSERSSAQRGWFRDRVESNTRYVQVAISFTSCRCLSRHSERGTSGRAVNPEKDRVNVSEAGSRCGLACPIA